jgi:hypothetical protein
VFGVVSFFSAKWYRFCPAPKPNAISLPLHGKFSIDLARFLRVGDNYVQLTCKGPPGTFADVIFSDGTFAQLLPDESVESIEIPKSFDLKQNYPNPFNAQTMIPLDIPTGFIGKITLDIFDGLGRLVRQVYDGSPAPGIYVFPWDGRDRKGFSVKSGFYFYRITAGQFVQTRRMTLIK